MTRHTPCDYTIRCLQKAYRQSSEHILCKLLAPVRVHVCEGGCHPALQPVRVYVLGVQGMLIVVVGCLVHLRLPLLSGRSLSSSILLITLLFLQELQKYALNSPALSTLLISYCMS